MRAGQYQGIWLVFYSFSVLYSPFDFYKSSGKKFLRIQFSNQQFFF